jgi:hypothetical protein
VRQQVFFGHTLHSSAADYCQEAVESSTHHVWDVGCLTMYACCSYAYDFMIILIQ